MTIAPIDKRLFVTSKTPCALALVSLLMYLANASGFAQPARLDSVLRQLTATQTARGLDTTAFGNATNALASTQITAAQLSQIESVAARFDPDLGYYIKIFAQAALTATDKNGAIDYGKKMVQLLEKSRAPQSALLRDNVLSNLRVAYRTSPRLAEGFYYFNQKLHDYQARQDSAGLAACQYVLGGFYRVTGLMDQAIYHMKKSLAYMNRQDTTAFFDYGRTNGRLWWSNNTGVLGDYYLLKGDYASAIHYARISFLETFQPRLGKSNAANNIALAKILSGQSDSVVYYLQAGRADALKRKAYLNLPALLQTEALYNLKFGSLGLAEKQLGQAWQLIHQYHIQNNAVGSTSDPDYYLALVRIRQNRLAEAAQLLTRDIAQVRNLRLYVLRDYKLLAEVYDQAEKPSQASQSYRAYVHLQDSLLADQAKYRSISFETEQQMNAKDQSITRLQSDNKLAALTRNFTIGIAGLLLLLAATLYYRYVSKQRANTLLQAQRDQTQQALTDLKATQQQLIQKEKLASLGELTAGIAHEIQNPLNFVNNFSEVSTELIDELTQEAQAGHTEDVLAIAGNLRANLHKIHHHGGRASSIVKGMLEHSRTSAGEMQPTDLNALVDEYMRLAYPGARAKDTAFTCELVTHFDPAIGQINLIPQEIGRVLLNLFSNAFYAVRERQQQVEATYQPTVTITTVKTPAGVQIRIADNGTGMPESVQAKIFQPFFTTKPTGEGTGLGLSLSYDIITKGHGSSLSVTSQQGQGTEFVITLPIV